MDCIICRGTLIEGLVNHIVDINGHIIIIKNVPANICTQCGEYYVENKIVLILERLIDEVLNSNAEVLIINYPDAAA